MGIDGSSHLSLGGIRKIELVLHTLLSQLTVPLEERRRYKYANLHLSAHCLIATLKRLYLAFLGLELRFDLHHPSPEQEHLICGFLRALLPKSSALQVLLLPGNVVLQSGDLLRRTAHQLDDSPGHKVDSRAVLLGKLVQSLPQILCFLLVLLLERLIILDRFFVDRPILIGDPSALQVLDGFVEVIL